MLPSILTTFLFAFSAVCATQATRLLGSLKANFWRLIIATLFLAGWAHSFGQGLRGPALPVFWVVLNSLSGPALGVGCYQWALAHTPSGIVLPIVATSPLAVIPLAYFFEGEIPSARSLMGGLLAVIGSVGLTIAYR